MPRDDNDDERSRKLFVGGLDYDTTDGKLESHFSQWGELTDFVVMKFPDTRRSRGFGFITFSNPEAVDRVLSVPSHCLDGKKIDPKHATPKSKSKANKTKKIFVGGVSQETSAEEVKAYFSQFGEFWSSEGFLPFNTAIIYFQLYSQIIFKIQCLLDSIPPTQR